MFSNFKLPHGVMVALSGLSVLLTWIVAEQSKGAISLPAAVVGLIPIVQMVLGMFSPSISGGSSGGGSAGGGKSDSVPTVPPPPRLPGAMRRMLSVSGLAIFGVAAFAACGDIGCAAIESAIAQDAPADLTPIEQRVFADIMSGMPLGDVVKDIAKTGVQDALQIVYDTLASLINKAMKNPKLLKPEQVSEVREMQSHAHMALRFRAVSDAGVFEEGGAQ